ncbi:MAG: carboxypeptidase-like regulatory domain-containing protein [Chitinophagales bacterium]|nr:carboxypeptidase-like regulatory domain-containing protein [Chitinophagales bacterium]
MLKYIIFIFCIFFSYPSLIAQQVVIQGMVKDTTNKPIVGASVILRANDSNGIIKYYKITDENGIFKITISNINQQLFFQISSVGFVTYSEHLTNPLISLNKIFTLQSYLGNLPEVFIKDNPDIIKKNDTTTYMVAAFERGNENNIGDLLKNLPGIIVTDNGKVIFNGKMIDRVLIEDDDIFGNNYAALIKNVSTNGLDKIDIIEHYNDRSKIENSKKEKGNETVLNLRYKKKKLRLYSSINSAGGYSIENYEVKADIVSLIPNAKFVSTANMNSLGTTGSYLLGRENNLNLFENYNEEPITKVATVSNPVNFHDITPNNISTSRALFNTSKFITINSQLKVSKKIMVKESVSIIADDYTQSKKTIEVFNNPLQPLVIEEDEKLVKNNKQFDVALEASWLPNAKFQSVLKYNISSINATHQNNGFLFQSPFFQNLYLKAKNHQLTLKNTKLITEKSLSTL